MPVSLLAELARFAAAKCLGDSKRTIGLLNTPLPGRFLGGLVNLWIVHFHVSLGRLERREPELRVESVRIARNQAPAPESLQPRVPPDATHEQLAHSLAAEPRLDKNISNIGICRIVGDHARETNLFSSFIGSETEGILNRPCDRLLRNTACPITGTQEGMDCVEIQPGFVSTDEKTSLAILLHLTWSMDTGFRDCALRLHSAIHASKAERRKDTRYQPSMNLYGVSPVV
jgi:hypothetical protein